MSAVEPVYFHAIASLAQTIPGLPFLDGVDTTSEIMANTPLEPENTAKHTNLHTILRNRMNTSHDLLTKTIPGHDMALVVAVTRPDQRQGVVMPPVPAPVGSLPPGFDSNSALAGLTSSEISRLMLFYNDTFGIVASDNETTRNTKFIITLVRYY
ncbi:hypothetical protein H0H81_007177 [Sphagnurus paluster]|uniref:Uncharacterized protein n=1 Tax=Sphagnurus paluster TaxID=117069 RepID=A0A9P7GRL9_9AGAR|nr:hypothetical protein H0H81_007177 [Sphagnurus paluster]